MSSSSLVAIFTGGGDKPYALGLTRGLVSAGLMIDFIGSDFLAAPEVLCNPAVRFLNLRGDVRPGVSNLQKLFRVSRYYLRLLRYAASARPVIFHILWNDKLELFDRTLLMLYYHALGKRIVLTVHNVNGRQRDGNDSALNRTTLRAQYKLADHLFVHTARMKEQLVEQFGVVGTKISVIPFGINDTIPVSDLTSSCARERLGLSSEHKVILFFGNIAPYKGVDLLIEAMFRIANTLPECRLVIAGRPKGAESYWNSIERRIVALDLCDVIIRRIEYVPDEETEVYFKAADLLVLPYTHVFQSGVLFLGYNFGLPVVASDVGSLRDDIVNGETGFVCEAGDAIALAEAIQRYFASDLYGSIADRRQQIRQFAISRHSWEMIAVGIKNTYRLLLRKA